VVIIISFIYGKDIRGSMNTEILEQIGLSKNEVKVYFALLELDQSSATPIVKKADIPNSKVYPTLDKLIKKGLVSFVIKNNVKYFQASDPNNLIDYIHEKENELSNQKEEIKKIVPQIELKRKMSKTRQESFVYEGVEGIRAAFNDIINTLEKGDEYFVFTLGQELKTDELKLFFANYHRKRIEKGITARLIANKTMKNIFSKHHTYKGMKIRYTDLKMPTGIFIYQDKVMTLVWEDVPTAFIIKSENNANSYKGFFEEMWKSTNK